ncbi:hypothetical protein HMI55_004249 [Coelomomyces lativittatus]|nr:hypothetical protein HMI55_004249 [Coelomomyces lativittatus]
MTPPSSSLSSPSKETKDDPLRMKPNTFLTHEFSKGYFEEIEPLCQPPCSDPPSNAFYTSGCFTLQSPMTFIPLCRPENDVPPIKVRISKSVSHELQKTNYQPPTAKTRWQYNDKDSLALNAHLHKACSPSFFHSRARSMYPKSMSLQSYIKSTHSLAV